MTTKEGGEQVQGRAFFRITPGVKNAGPDVYDNKGDDCEQGAPCTDLEKYFAERDALLNSVDDAGDPIADDVKKGQLYTFTEDTIDDIGYGDDPRYEAEISVGGPLTSKGGFFFTGRFLNDHGMFPNALNRSARYSLKLTHAPTQDVKVTGNIMIDDGGKLGGWVNRDFSGRFKSLITFPSRSPNSRGSAVPRGKLFTCSSLREIHALHSSAFGLVDRETEFSRSECLTGEPAGL